MEILIGILPAILLILCGFLLKKAGFLKTEDGSTLLKVVFYVGAPAFIYLAIINSDFESSFLPLLLISPFVLAVTIPVLLIFRKTLLKDLSLKTFGAMSLGVMIINTGFLIPFIEQGYGQEGVSKLIIADLGNSVVLYSLIYAIAVYWGGGKRDMKKISKKLLYSPPIWAIVLGLLAKSLRLETPELVMSFLELAARLVSPGLLLALGLKLDPQLKNLNLVSYGVLLRFILGTFVGFLFVELFNLEGLTAIIIILVSAAPFGNNSITFSDLEGLDSEYASVQVSAGILFGIIYISFLMVFLNSLYM